MSQQILLSKRIGSNRKSFTIGFKRAAINHYDKTKSKRKTTYLLGIRSKTCLIEWIDNRDTIFDPTQRVNSRRVKFVGNKSQFPEADSSVYSWYLGLKESHAKVESLLLQNKMVEEVKRLYPEESKVTIYSLSNSFILN